MNYARDPAVAVPEGMDRDRVQVSHRRTDDDMCLEIALAKPANDLAHQRHNALGVRSLVRDTTLRCCDEYRRFAREFHTARFEEMIDFYFNGLAYPRTTMQQMVMMAAANGFTLHAVINEPSRNVEKLLQLTDAVPDFWNIVRDVNPTVTVEEMLSGRYHIVFRRTH